jgi:DNA-binding transcriptional MerR regulator
MKFVVQQYIRKMTTKGVSIDKISKLLDVLDKHIKEENCSHTAKELLKEYENYDLLNR